MVIYDRGALDKHVGTLRANRADEVEQLEEDIAAAVRQGNAFFTESLEDHRRLLAAFEEFRTRRRLRRQRRMRIACRALATCLIVALAAVAWQALRLAFPLPPLADRLVTSAYAATVIVRLVGYWRR